MGTRKKLLTAAVFFVGAFIAVKILEAPKKSPALTESTLKSAEALWQNVKPPAYRMEVRVNRDQRYVVEAKNGTVVSLTLGGNTVPERMWATWSVDGMFRMLEEELTNAKSPQRAFGVSDPSLVFMDASFDPKTGAPIRFLRQVSGKNLTAEWTIEKLSF